MSEQTTNQTENVQEQAEPQAPAQPAFTATLPEGVTQIWGTGRRKKAIARVRIRPGTGTFKINNREVEDFFTEVEDRNAAYAPLQTANMAKSWDVFVNVHGGGITGQAGAVMLGLARALARAVPEVEHSLRDRGLLTRDARMKERKKYGQKGARKRFQFSKR
ncbi:MAG: 30S ribosomal protein S9 [Planctomycetes bacterium ADurb.Bin126]|nr:MAG: 30S ribosomal protein S9 [Planctomycetes bacterium ADurb.Bin126]HOD81530.1 30S ribosomal protein S9 [Phycisphaerae bacterium]HQL75047.1 30S ribosomal protein S9 [Phycisphaerae bacterium]